MYCTNCGSKLEKDSKFCSHCGEKINSDIDQDRIENTLVKTTIDDDTLEEIFIGKNYDKIKQQKICWPIFFLGAYYLLYRKMWAYAFLWIGVLIATGIVMPHYISLVSLSMAIILAATFNHLYLDVVHKRIEKIKQKNQDKTTEELRTICEKKGGVSILAPVLTAIFISIIASIIVVVVVVSGFTENILNEVTKEIKEEIDPIIENNSKTNISFVAPSGFKKIIETDTYTRYSYQEHGSYCTFKIQNASTKLYKTPEDYLKSFNYYSTEEDDNPIKDKVINKIVWKYQAVESSYSSKYYYATKNQDRVYLIEYNINSDYNDYCKDAHYKLIESVKFVNNNKNSNSI